MRESRERATQHKNYIIYWTFVKCYVYYPNKCLTDFLKKEAGTVRQKIQRSARVGAFTRLVIRADMKYAVTTAIQWKGVRRHDDHDSQFPATFGCSAANAAYQHQRHDDRPRGRIGGSENISNSNRQNSSRWRTGHCAVATSNGGAVVQLRPGRRVYCGLVRPSLSPAATGHRGRTGWGDIFPVEIAVPGNSRCISGHSPRAALSQRGEAGIAQCVSVVRAVRSEFALDPCPTARAGAAGQRLSRDGPGQNQRAGAVPGIYRRKSRLAGGEINGRKNNPRTEFGDYQ